MKDMGIILRVTQPMKGCAGMVVVPKHSVEVHILLKPLNESDLQETHPIPKVDQTLGASLFNKLDVNSGFWQIPLAEESRHLKIFITLSVDAVLKNCPSEYQACLSYSRNE